MISFFEFRIKKDLEKIRKIDINPDFNKEIYVRGYYWTSKEGYPINYERVGFSNVKKAFQEYTLDELEDYFV